MKSTVAIGTAAKPASTLHGAIKGMQSRCQATEFVIRRIAAGTAGHIPGTIPIRADGSG